MQNNHKLASRIFRKYLRLQARRGLPVERMLNFLIRSWLTLDWVREQFKIDEMQPHEAVSLIQYIESSIRQPWIKNAEITRKKNETRVLKNKKTKRGS